MSYAQVLVDREVSETPVSSARIANLETRRVIIFMGDAIPPHEKFEMPEIKGFGGIYMPHIRTLPRGEQNGLRGMVYKCTFTPLDVVMKPEWKDMIAPDARDRWETEYVQTVVENGVSKKKNIRGFMGSDMDAVKEGEFRHKFSDHIVSKKLYPGDDVRMATQRSQPNGVGGVIEVTALLGASNAEIREAQLFFFPTWDNIRMGLEDLPETNRALETYIKTRIAAIPAFAQFDIAKKQKLESIGRDMLKSCSEFTRTGNQIITMDSNAMKRASKDDPRQTYSAISDHLLGPLIVKRKDDLLAGDHSAMNRVADAMEKQVTAGTDDRLLLLEERKQYVAEVSGGFRERDEAEEIRLGIRKPTIAASIGMTQPVPEAVVNATFSQPITPDAVWHTEGVTLNAPETVASEKECGRPKANGEPCTRLIAEGETGCWSHR